MKNEEETKKGFAGLFNLAEKDCEPVLFKDRGVVGFSFLKDYPEKGKFKPVKNQSGKMDSVALIKIGYYEKNVKDGLVKIFVSIHKVSRYLLNNHRDYNFEDKESPSLVSLNASKASKQPIDLEELTSYIFDIVNKKFYKGRKKTKIQPEEIIKTIYNQHLKTLKFEGSFFRAKVNSRDRLIKIIGGINDFLEKANRYLFGKEMQENESFAIGVFKPYNHKDLVTYKPERVNFLGIDFKVSSKTLLIFSFIIVISVYIDSLYISLKFIKPIRENASNEVFLISFAILALWIIDRLMPHLVLVIINTLIRIRSRLVNLRVKIK